MVGVGTGVVVGGMAVVVRGMERLCDSVPMLREADTLVVTVSLSTRDHVRLSVPPETDKVSELEADTVPPDSDHVSLRDCEMVKLPPDKERLTESVWESSSLTVFSLESVKGNDSERDVVTLRLREVLSDLDCDMDHVAEAE
jgi:hypothetical protein